MIGLLSPPAAMRLFSAASTPVRSILACGQRPERTSRVTCCEANALSRETETCGLFLIANASASFRESTLALVCDGAFGAGAFGNCGACACAWVQGFLSTDASDGFWKTRSDCPQAPV